ncbi:unnamed protein product [Euphydryas editha]|uniref:Uncharacterized protein n=1 Tax=Euphydryas editha TaxID=104508 RepID=A0AAU9V3R2_EUPED|nr:unnamed protein product [Euphydryas editha]
MSIKISRRLSKVRGTQYPRRTKDPRDWSGVIRFNSADCLRLGAEQQINLDVASSEVVSYNGDIVRHFLDFVA